MISRIEVMQKRWGASRQNKSVAKIQSGILLKRSEI